MSLLSALVTAAPALLPAVSDGVRGLFQKWTGGAGARPVNVGELIQLMQAENDRLRILAELDRPGPKVAAWAETARALQRPAVATWAWTAYMAALLLKLPAEAVEPLGQMAGMVTFYLFGHWGYSQVKGR